MKTLFLLIPILAFAQTAPDTTLSVQFQNWVFYQDQTGDATKYATAPNITPADMQRPLQRYLIIADVVSVGGKPATGTFFAHGIAIGSASPDPLPGRITADFSRNQMHEFVLDIMTPDKVQVGSLFGYWLGAGASAPGAPLGAGLAAIVGGTGAYVGVHGQGANIGSSNLRTASVTEDPAFRRVNGGGQLKFGLTLSGASLPKVMAAYHASDSSRVTASSPAQSGEMITLQVKAGWPTKPSLAGGGFFSGDPLQQTATPVEALVNDVPAEISNNVGWPGTREQYRVDIRLPGGLSPGTVTLQLNGAYLPGLPFDIPVR